MDLIAGKRIVASALPRTLAVRSRSGWHLDVEGPIEALLRRQQVLVVHQCGIGTRVTCVSGSVWVTIAGDRRDHVLGIHQSLCLGLVAGDVVVNALAQSRVVILDPQVRRTSVDSSWRSLLARQCKTLVRRFQLRNPKGTP